MAHNYDLKFKEGGKSLLVFSKGETFLGIGKQGQFLGIFISSDKSPEEVKTILDNTEENFKFITKSVLQPKPGELGKSPINILDVVPA
jgi:hypothetical protein